MWDEIKNISSTKKELQEFGLTLGIFFGLFGIFWFWRAKDHPEYFFATGAVFLVFGIFLPGVLKPAQKSWMGLALVIGELMSRVILCLLFYGILTPISLALRITGKELLPQKWKEKKDTFWTDRAINDARSESGCEERK